MLKKPKKSPIKKLKAQADAIYSLYIRTKYADPHTGLVKCVSCGVSKPIPEMQNGHFISRGSNHLRFNGQNCHPQCVGCNVFKKGNYPAYAAYMVRTYGPDILDQLQEEAKTLHKFTATDLEIIISDTKNKLEDLPKY